MSLFSTKMGDCLSNSIYCKQFVACVSYLSKTLVNIYCHVIAHGDDRNKINTILPLEWTVVTRQKSDR